MSTQTQVSDNQDPSNQDGSVIIAALYQFKDLPDYLLVKPILKRLCQEQGIKGTLILASEGINGTVAGSRIAMDALKSYLIDTLGFVKMEYKESFFHKQPFYRMKVLTKKEIVTLGRPDIRPHEKAGTYVSPQDWNTLISSPDVVLIDVRNDYEVQIGTFKQAINPKTETFKAFPEYVETQLDPNKHKKVAMFCTGGIRCEKASAYMMSMGFPEVYHLKGGILQYLEETPPDESLWDGECFVFDQRVAVTHGVEPGQHETCFGCRYPLATEDKQSSQYEEGVSCPHCIDTLTPEKSARLRERHRQVQLAESRGACHLG